ncbi:type II toxin-antitoxin system VapC family toxin [Mucilaginibacter sp.]
MNGTEIFIDTNICIYLLGGDVNLADLLEGQTVFISIITEIELYASKNLSSAEIEIIDTFIQSVNIVELDKDVKLKAIELRRTGLLKLPDSIIAASAINKNIPIVSADKAFGKISDLEVIAYRKNDR